MIRDVASFLVSALVAVAVFYVSSAFMEVVIGGFHEGWYFAETQGKFLPIPIGIGLLILLVKNSKILASLFVLNVLLLMATSILYGNAEWVRQFNDFWGITWFNFPNAEFIAYHTVIAAFTAIFAKATFNYFREKK